MRIAATDPRHRMCGVERFCALLGGLEKHVTANGERFVWETREIRVWPRRSKHPRRCEPPVRP
jgi:hypothetical protein